MTFAGLVLSALLATDPAGESPRRVVIPEEIFLELRSGPAPHDPDCPPEPGAGPEQAAQRSARDLAPVGVAYADEVDLVGHLEGMDGHNLRLLGRRINIEVAEFAGGGRASLVPGVLLRVIGQGAQNGLVRAAKVEILPPPDPASAARLNREVDKFKTKFWRQAKQLEDPDLREYVQGIVSRLIPDYVPGGDRHFEVFVVKDPDLNAFALPDGTMVVNTGLIARMENEAQLATVLSHEMAHITQRHADRSMKRDTEATLLSWGSMLASIALGVGGNAEAGEGIKLISSAIVSAWSRTQEDEADIVGLRYLYSAGYDVRQAPAVWRTFQLLYGDMTRAQNFFYGSHSTGRDREHNLEHEIWKSYESSGLLGGRVQHTEFLAATATAVRENALADLARGNFEWANWGIAKALAAAPEDPRNYVALGSITLQGGGQESLRAAITDFRRAIELDPTYPDAWRELGFALLRARDKPAAAKALARYLELKPDASDAETVKRALART